MDCVFNWINCQSLSDEERAEVEEKIRMGLKIRDDEFELCHSGPVLIPLNIVGALRSNLVGNIHCSCGKPYFKIIGTSDGSTASLDTGSFGHGPAGRNCGSPRKADLCAVFDRPLPASCHL